MNARFARISPVAITAASLLFCSIAVAQDPAAAPQAPVVAPPPAATQPSVARADLPAAKTIMDKSIEAMGGEKAFDAINSSLIKGAMSMPMGQLDLDMSWMKPNKVLIRQVVPGMGDSTMGSDGTVSWVKGPTGFQILEPAQAKQMQEQSNMFRMVVRMRDEAKELKTVDQVKFNERDCYKVSAIDKDGNEQFLFFDVEEHLIRGIEATQESQMGPVTSTIKFGEWKEDAGLKFFTKIDIEQMGMTMTLTFNEVKFNTLEPSVFALPAEVEAMLKEKEGAASQPAGTAPAAPGTGGGH